MPYDDHFSEQQEHRVWDIKTLVKQVYKDHMACYRLRTRLIKYRKNESWPVLRLFQNTLKTL